MIHRFADCEIDLERRELRREGAVVAVEPQVFDVLGYLLSHRERVVSKEELLDNVWGDRFVSESALTSRIKFARRAVGDTGQSQHVIRTVHGRGYCFVAPVDTGAPAAAAAPVRTESPFTPDTAGPGPTRSLAGTWPLLGRALEVERIGDAFRDGQTGGVLLTGPAGVGKTRLAAECLRLAEEAGVPVARVSGHPETRPLPLAAVAHLLPSDVAHPTGPEGELDRAAVFHRARAAVERVTAGQRAMVMVDDVDQLDELSRALMVSLVHARTIFVLATRRSTDDDDGKFTDEGVDLLVKDGHLRSFAVGPLGTETVESLLHRVLGGPIEVGTLTRLIEASMGNPGVLRQLVESAQEADNLLDRNGVWRLDRRLEHTSPTLELLVAERLGGLGDDEREALELVAVAGELSLSVLGAIVDDAVLERLERRGLLNVVDVDDRTEATLIHPLFAEVLRQQLPTMRGRRLRRTLADAVCADGVHRRRDRVRVVAWRLEAGGQVAPDALADAARLALIDGDEAMAERILQRAGSADRTPEIIQLLAEVEFRRGNADAVERLLGSIDPDELEEPVRAQIVRRRATNLFYRHGQFQRGVDMLRDGLEPLTDPAARQGLEAYRSLLLAMGGLVGEAIAESDALLGVATGAARLDLLRGRALALAVAGRGDDALVAIAEGWAIHDSLAVDLARPGVTLLMFAEVVALGELGRLDDAVAAAQRSLARRPDPATVGWIGLGQARLHLAAGRPAVIRKGLDPLVRATRALGHGATERWALALVASARLLEGDDAGAGEDLERVTLLEEGERGLFHADIDRAHAWLAVIRDEPAVGCQMLHTAAADARRLGKHTLEAALLHDVVRFGDAGAVVERLTELADTGQGALLQARACHAAGAATADAAQLEEAATLFEQSGATLLAAEAATQSAAAGGRGEAVDRAQRLRAALPPDVTTPVLGAPGE